METDSSPQSEFKIKKTKIKIVDLLNFKFLICNFAFLLDVA